VKNLREVNPNALVLSYVDVIEGPDNPNIPKNWWDLNDKGERWSGWPGMLRINMKLPEVLQFNLDKVRTEVFARDCLDGVFYDCWRPDDWLVPRTAQLRDGKALVMLNDWNMPRNGFENLNGVLSEDELNRVIEGKVDFEDFIARYLRWTRESRKPVVTTLVCIPETLNADPWRWAKMPRAQVKAEREKAWTGDVQTMRFGLATALMGDGYFAYDSSRGDWWWFKEYDAPLGYPKGPARRNPDGTWQRNFDGGTVLVNGTPYDTIVQVAANCRDVSTDRVGTRFTLPMFDGRIFLPTNEPATAGQDTPPRLTAAPPSALRVVKLDRGLAAVQTPGGLDLRFEASGELRQILWRGKLLMSGGWPIIAAPPFKRFYLENASGGPVEPPARPDEARLVYKGVLAESAQRVDFTETVTVRPDNRFTLHFDFTAATDLNLRMWRHYFMLPVARYAGAVVRPEGKTLTLPVELKDATLVSKTGRVVIEPKDATITIESSLPLSLVDHRKYNTPDYLLSGYPAHGAVKQGAKVTVEMTVTVSAR